MKSTHIARAVRIRSMAPERRGSESTRVLSASLWSQLRKILPRGAFLYRAWLTLAILVALLVSASQAYAPKSNQALARRLTDVSLADLGKIEVTTASKEPVPVNRTPAAIYVITQEDIRRSGATSIAEVLRLAPGVAVSRVDSNTWAIGMRGFGSTLSRSVLVLVDGRSVYTPLFAGVYWQVQDTLLEDIERIEVIRGPGGTIWGANAVNGIINIITKSAKQTKGMLASVGGGSIDQGFASFRYGGGNGESFNYRMYGKAFTRGPQFHSTNGQFDDWRMGQTGFRADWELRQRDTFTLQGDLYRGQAGQRLGIASYSAPLMSILEQNAELAGGNLLGRWLRTLGAGSGIQVQSYYDRTSRSQANFAESRDTFDIDLIHSFPLPLRQKFLWGLGGRLSSGNVTQVIPTVVFTPNHHTEKLYHAFIQDEVPIVGDQLSITIGSKFLHNNYSGFEFAPSGRLLWTPNSKQTFWGAVTRAVRTPSRVEEDLQLTGPLASSPLTFFRLVGDRQFSSESLIGYEAGYRGLIHPTFHLDVAFFYNNYDDLLSIEPGAPFSEASPPPPHLVLPFLIRNGLFGNTSGFEIAPEWAPTRWWRLKSSYSYLHIDLSNEAGSLDVSSARSIEGSSPQHQGSVQFFLNLPGRLEFDQTVRYVSALPAKQVRAYTTADVRFNWHATQSLDFSIIGQNLLQPQHAEFAGNPGGPVGIRRSAYLKVTWQISEK